MTKVSSAHAVAGKAGRSSSWSRRKLAVSAAVLAVLLVSIAAVGLQASYSSAISSSESSARSLNSEAVYENDQFAKTVANQTGNSVSGILKFYTNASVVSWGGNITSGGPTNENSGSPFDWKGTYSGLSEIANLYLSALQCFDMSQPFAIRLSVLNLTTTAVEPSIDNATFQLYIQGDCQSFMGYSGIASVRQEWVVSNGNWTIERENWDCLSTATQCLQLCALNPGAPAGST